MCVRVLCSARAESYRAPMLPSRMTKPPPKNRFSSQLRPLSEMIPRENIVKLSVEAKEKDDTQEDQFPPLAPTAATAASKGGEDSAPAAPSETVPPAPEEDSKRSPPTKPLHKRASSMRTMNTSAGSTNLRQRHHTSVARSASRRMSTRGPALQIPTDAMTSTLFGLKKKDMELAVKILIRKILTLLAAICDNPYNGVKPQALAEKFAPILFDTGVANRNKAELETVCCLPGNMFAINWLDVTCAANPCTSICPVSIRSIQICEALILDRANETKVTIDCVERLITSLCNQTSNDAAATSDPSSSTLASLIACSPASADARQQMRESLVCPAPYRHLDLPYDTLFDKLSPDMLVIFINAILCEVATSNPANTCVLVVCCVKQL